MYVHAFGGSWLEHPFWSKRFIVKPSDVERIAGSAVPYVIIDDEQGIGLVAEAADDQAPKAAAGSVADRLARRRQGLPPRKTRATFGTADRRALARQRAADGEVARAMIDRSTGTMRSMLEDARLGRAVNVTAASGLVRDVETVVQRSSDTLLEILRLKKKDQYSYMHSVAVCALMITFARHLGKDAQDVEDHGLAGLLLDIGKTGIDDAILKKTGPLTEDELDRMRQHCNLGYQLLMMSGKAPDIVLDVCLHHHERIDGTGYPHGISGDALSEAARMSAICDAYDAQTSERAYSAAALPTDALAEMWQSEGQFDRDLLFAFMQSIDVFPPGMIVRLGSERLAIVLEPVERGARPLLLCFYDTHDRAPTIPAEITLGDDWDDDTIEAVVIPKDWGLSPQECTISYVTGAEWRERAIEADAA